ncbi:MAG: polysaccharide deacetylase family protein [Erysipelotrichaceae bacterium]|nr:polysaccharide deacetylase family protein [Erysipelotrichaceae bacterium]
MAKRKIKSNVKSALIIIVLCALIFGVFYLLNSTSSSTKVSSIHSDAKTYKSSRCTAFYPDSKAGRQLAKQVCNDVSDKNEHVYDYSLIPYGDYYMVSYGNGYQYYADQSFKPLVISESDEEGLRIVADYLRIAYKKNQPKTYYDSSFIVNTTYEEINFEGITYEIENENLICHLPDYDLPIEVPLKYMQTHIGMNFGYENEDYVKPVYIDDEHPVIALTFDDGPMFWYPPGESSSQLITDLLYKYDASATFFVSGTCLESRDSWSDYEVYTYLKQSISQGNEYASYIQDHDYYLTDYYTADEIERAIKGPANTLEQLIGYKVQLCRPPGGVFSNDIQNVSPYPLILWTIDSDDWELDTGEKISNSVKTYMDDDLLETGDIILFHDIYFETADAIEILLPQMIDKGYQLVTVSEMLNYMNIDLETLGYYYNANYYE